MNSFTNNGLITLPQTLVGRWPPCPVLQHPIYVIIMEDGYHYGDRYLMEDGAWKPSSYLVCLACRFFCFTLVVGGFCVIVSRTVVSAPRPPTPNMFARLFTPLSLRGWESRVGAARGRGCYLDGCWRTGHGDHRPTMICLA